MQCDALAAVHYGTYNATFGERVYNASAACAARGAFSVGFADLDYAADLPEVALDAAHHVLRPRNATGLRVDAVGGLRCAAAPGARGTKLCKRRGRSAGLYALRPCDGADCGGGGIVKCAAPRCGPCDDPCAPAAVVRANADDVCYTLPCFSVSTDDPATRPAASVAPPPGWIDDPGFACFEYHPSMAAACFCRFNLGVKKAAYVLAGRRDLADEVDVCEATIHNYLKAFLLKLGVAVFVVFVNELVRVGVYALTDFERHSSHTTRLVSLVSKLTGAQFVNTALLALARLRRFLCLSLAGRATRRQAINASLDREEAHDALNAASDRTNLLDGTHRGMAKAWYASVGASLTVTMASNVVVPQVSFVFKVVKKEVLRRLLRPFVKTQAALDALYKPPPWQVERSYAIALTTLAVTAMYAPGIPVLAVLATVALGVAYAVNKVLVLK